MCDAWTVDWGEDKEDGDYFVPGFNVGVFGSYLLGFTNDITIFYSFISLGGVLLIIIVELAYN